MTGSLSACAGPVEVSRREGKPLFDQLPLGQVGSIGPEGRHTGRLGRINVRRALVQREGDPGAVRRPVGCVVASPFPCVSRRRPAPLGLMV
jgi:hypothetical protein